jgi:hypothetical protein
MHGFVFIFFSGLFEKGFQEALGAGHAQTAQIIQT